MNLPDPVTGSCERNSLSPLLGWLVRSDRCRGRAHLFIVRGAAGFLNGEESISTLGNWSALEERGTTLLTLTFGLYSRRPLVYEDH